MISKTELHENIQVLRSSVIVDHSGMPGMFKTGIQVGPQMFYRQIKHGITILATGALPNRPRELLLDEHEAVMTQLDLEAIIEDDPERIKSFRNVVMIQCVGSRTPENPNCSRVCCQSAIKNALRLRAINPGASISILYRDMRTPDFRKITTREAREKRRDLYCRTKWRIDL